jgi:hypothetical protein
MKDIHSETIVLGSIGPVVLTSDNTPTAIDLRGHDGVEIVAGVGIQGVTFGTTNYVVLELSHSDDNETYSAVEDMDILGAEDEIVEGTTNYGILKTFFDTAHAAAATYRWGYIGGKRYLKFLINMVGTHSPGTPFHVAVVGQHPSVAPTVDQG